MYNISSASTLLLLLAILFITVQACSGTEPIISPDSERDNFYQPERPLPYPIDIPVDYLYAIQEGSRSMDGAPGDYYWQNEASYDLKAELLPEENKVNGHVKIQYQNNSPDQLRQLLLELAQNLHKAGTMKKDNTEITGGVDLRSVKVRGRELNEFDPEIQGYGGDPGYLVDATRLLIVLDETLNPGDSIDLEIEWSFIVPQEGAGGRMGRSRDNLFFIAYWYPHMAVYDDVIGWFTDPFLGNAEFYHGFADYSLEITAPDNWLVMATGDFLNPSDVLADHVYERYIEAGQTDEIVHIVSESDLGAATRQNQNGTLTWKFSAGQVRDVAFSATRESVWDGSRAAIGDLTGDGNIDYTRIHSFYRNSAPLWQDQAEYSQHSITFLSEYLDHPYPWPHMTSVEGADIIGGGMEYPMITVMGSYNNLGAQRLYGVTAHEFAHMWIPMIVSTNERRYTWMDEGFTTFNTHQANVDRYPGEFDNFDIFHSYLNIAGTDMEGPMMRWSDYHYPGPAYGVASYPKPASVLTALQGMLGEELFREAYLTFIEEWAYKHPYPWDFFHTIERVADTDLSWFWRSWYYETWVLDHAIGDVEDHGDSVTIEILDLGDVPMPVKLLIVLEDGTQVNEEIDVTYWLEGRRSVRATFDTGLPVERIEIDPHLLFPDADRSNNTWEK
jgi:hypothetical protein